MRLLFLVLILYSQSLMAYQSSLTSYGDKLKWNRSNVPLILVHNSNTLTSSQTSAIYLDSILQWNSSSSLQIIPVSSGNNQIRFENDFSIYGSAVVGVTEVNYDSNGLINKASIYLNEDDYTFTSTPGFPSNNHIYLGDVVTHELGHFLGLSHAEVLDSSMFYANYPGQRTIAADDKSGIRSLYDSGHGSIYGYVKGGSHIGVLGVHVQAISIKTGEAISAVSIEDGYFEINGLDLNDTYYLYTSPLKNPAALPGYFANVRNEFCPSSYVGSFYSACGRENDGLPQPLTLTSLNKRINVGVVSINCRLRANEDYSYEKIQSSPESLIIFDYAQEPYAKKAFVGYFRRNELSLSSFSDPDKFEVDLTSYNSFSGDPKWLKISISSQILGNPIEFSVKVERDDLEVSGSPFVKALPSSDGTSKLDISTLTPLSTVPLENKFDLEISAKRLASEDAVFSLPAFSRFGSLDWPYLLVVSIWDKPPLEDYQIIPDSELPLSDNESCLDAPLTYAVSKANIPDSDSFAADAGVTAAGCGTIEPPSNQGPPTSMALLSLGFLLMAMASNIVKRAKNFLS